MPTDCPGCFFPFSASGLATHLAQTTNLACRAAATELNDLFDVASSEGTVDNPEELGPNSQHSSMSTDRSHPPSPPEFTGDYFGDYEEDDLEWPVPGTDMPLPDFEGDDSESDWDFEYNLPEPGWEPDPPAPGVFDDCDIPMEYDIPPSTPTQDLLDRQGIENHLWNDPTIEKFPIPTAGKVFGHEKENTYERSRHQFSSPNVHEPFSTQIEWEIARWAKLRGPSSTAFTELLAIDGVCPLIVMYLLYTNYIHGIGCGKARAILQEFKRTQCHC